MSFDTEARQTASSVEARLEEHRLLASSLREQTPDEGEDRIVAWRRALGPGERAELSRVLRRWLHDDNPWRQALALRLGIRLNDHDLVRDAMRMTLLDDQDTESLDEPRQRRFAGHLIEAIRTGQIRTGKRFLAQLATRPTDTTTDEYLQIKAKTATCLLRSPGRMDGCVAEALSRIRSSANPEFRRLALAWLVVVAPRKTLMRLLSDQDRAEIGDLLQEARSG